MVVGFLEQKIIEKKGEYLALKKDLAYLNSSIISIEKHLEETEKAQLIIQDVALQIQKQIQFHIEEIVTAAINSVFPETYKFKLDFVIRRNVTEVDILLEKNGKQIDPLTEVGGGLLDILSLALRISLWSLFSKAKNNTIILDEPFKFLSRDLQYKAGEMLKKISNDLNLQLIIVTHIPDLIESADKIFEIKQINGENVIC
jgi:DNA repair exonuclease SbcCD ATPase subunit